MNHIDQALKEINEADKFGRERHEMKFNDRKKEAKASSAEHTHTSQGCPRHKCQNDDPAELSVRS